MPSSLTKTIEAHINKKIESYIAQVSSKFNLDPNDLTALWNDLNGIKAKKVSNFQNYCRIQRPKIKSDKPDISFGDMNKELGRLWKGLSSDEQNSYH